MRGGGHGYSNWRVEDQNVALLDEQIPNQVAQLKDRVLGNCGNAFEILDQPVEIHRFLKFGGETDVGKITLDGGGGTCQSQVLRVDWAPWTFGPGCRPTLKGEASPLIRAWSIYSEPPLSC